MRLRSALFNKSNPINFAKKGSDPGNNTIEVTIGQPNITPGGDFTSPNTDNRNDNRRKFTLHESGASLHETTGGSFYKHKGSTVDKRYKDSSILHGSG